jgi:hypothetical protein
VLGEKVRLGVGRDDARAVDNGGVGAADDALSERPGAARLVHAYESLKNVGVSQDIARGHAVGDLKALADDGVVLQVLAHVGVLNDHGNAVLLQQVAATDTRQLQNLRCLEGTRRQDDFGAGRDLLLLAVFGEDLDARGHSILATRVKNDFVHHSLGEDDEVWPLGNLGSVVPRAGIASGVGSRVDARVVLEGAQGLAVAGISRDLEAEVGKRLHPCLVCHAIAFAVRDMDGPVTLGQALIEVGQAKQVPGRLRRGVDRGKLAEVGR